MEIISDGKQSLSTFHAWSVRGGAILAQSTSPDHQPVQRRNRGGWSGVDEGGTKTQTPTDPARPENILELCCGFVSHLTHFGFEGGFFCFLGSS